MASRGAGMAHVVLGTEIFWEQEDPQDYPEVSNCPVCGTTIDWSGCCSRECHNAWNGPMDYDPMDYDQF